MVSSKRNTTSANSNTANTVASNCNSSGKEESSGKATLKSGASILLSSASGVNNKTVAMNEKKDKNSPDECVTKYKEGERVLCFEPDPTKVRVIYDAKILQISITPDEKKSKTSPEFLVHFQGWNASWDRFVPQSYLLKVFFNNMTFILNSKI